MTEFRTEVRTGCLVHGKVSSPELMNSPVDCTIWDISPEGARLIIDHGVTLPDKISVSTPFAEEPRPAEVCWRRTGEVGIRLLKKPGHASHEEKYGRLIVSEPTKGDILQPSTKLECQLQEPVALHTTQSSGSSTTAGVQGTTPDPGDRPFTYVGEDARILVTDDDPILREFASVYLTTPSTSVQVAENGEEGLRLLDDGAFDIALIDLEMPGMGGLEMIRRLRAEPRFQDLPIVVVTGREDISSIDMAYEAGATSFVTKPVNWRVMSYQLRYVLRAQRFYSARSAQGLGAA